MPIHSGYTPPKIPRNTNPTKPCCAGCRRGIPGYGELPCGKAGCDCHNKARAEAFLATRRQINEDEKGKS